MSTNDGVPEEEIRRAITLGGETPWLVAAAISHKGRVRSENQDRFALETLSPDAAVAIVADGMGGHMGGSHAAEIAARTILNGIQADGDASDQPTYDLMSASFSLADEAIRARASRDAHLGGMGTTSVAAVIFRDRCIHLYTGDSRLYQYRDGKEIYRTKDHSVVRYLEEEGLLTADEARNHPMRSRLTSSLGGGPAERKLVLEPRWAGDEDDEDNGGPSNGEQKAVLSLEVGDVLLLCSDGLCGEVEPKKLSELMEAGGEPDELARRCVTAALEAGGRDNVTVIVLKVK